MKIDRKSFDKIFESKFWIKLKESIVPFESTPVKSKFLDELYSGITEFTYNPKNPRDYIVINKHNGISRYVPTFSRKDYCVYFLCIKLLENEIAINRVNGTYGGWTLGNPIRLKEEQEILELDYIPFNTINEFAWANEWQSFQNIAKTYRDLDDWNYFINLDIANFYDCINLTILERKIRHVVPKSKQDVVTLLFHFLQNWNKKLEGYNLKTVGIPQDEIGDCSRILANFYLQDYDLIMNNLCDKYQAKYIRFADDQIIYTKDLLTARNILFDASRELLKINLNFNSSKVKEFNSKDEFDFYWSFEIFELLKSKNNKRKINSAIEKYFENLDRNLKFRDNSVLKRILSIDSKFIELKFKHRLISMFFNPDFLAQLTVWHFKRIREFISNDNDFFQELDKMVYTVPFNSYHYNLLAFYKIERPDYNCSVIEKRIEEIKLK
ncbi:Reverse transcriptase (RNA-dependent DNA polymerase) [Flavobacterium sp. 9R]|uniref:RNA-directed DNA polymerase n=1 Tax=Flavobacterium sp. 9R TaxID=2653143 RepID=UPI0012F38365|nr:RNA-directed DNA polymerase [Flavobacterium sp. 9R]VXB37654.1 Reverse transcriptase (RNA-dependent DNA polymerase) [Flavobacterium sp. 9R]